MKILFVTTHPPFPPIDGVRIPEAHHLLALRQEHQVDCLVLKCEDFQYEAADLEETRNHVDQLTVLEMRKRNKLYAFLRELLFQEPYYGRWYLSRESPFNLVAEKYDLVWCGTAPAVAVGAQNWFRRRIRANRYVAGLSDIHSLVIISASRESTDKWYKFGRHLRKKLMYAHGLLLKMAETKMLKKYDLCTMQTRVEAEWLLSMKHSLDENKICVLPNGVNSELFKLPVDGRDRHIFFVGLVSGLYCERMIWFFDNCWQEIRKKYPGLKCSVIGKRARKGFDEYLSAKGVEYIPYVESLEEVYRKKAILIAPIFKGYGIINKVIEAMAAGCLVVGDRTAFSGIDGFKDGEHALVAETSIDFTRQILRGLESANYLEDVRVQGRELVRRNFDWNDRHAMILEKTRALN